MEAVGYAYLIKALGLAVPSPGKPAVVSRSVNRRMETEAQILFPANVALTDTPLGHLEFALRNEGIDLATIAAALPQIGREAIVERWRETPNGEYIRRIAFLWEWLSGTALDAGVKPSGRYIDLFPADQYATAPDGPRQPTYRVRNNALGNPAFCPVVPRAVCPDSGWLEALLSRAVQLAESEGLADAYKRAVRYLYLSETRGSFAIEQEKPSAQKEERFVQLLRRAAETPRLREEELVEIQNAAVRHDFAREASYRYSQNWLENSTGQITFLPHPAEGLEATMAGWEAFANAEASGIDPLVRAACASFGLVYIHPFMDGNGRLHRYVIHHILARSGLIPPDMILPISAVLMKNIERYHAVLTAFSGPITRLWDYRRLEDGPHILKGPGPIPYRYPRMGGEVAFLKAMLQQTVEEELPEELAWLSGYDAAYQRIDAQYDLPANEISRLIRMIRGNHGRLAQRKRGQFSWLPAEVLAGIEEIVQEAFQLEDPEDD